MHACGHDIHMASILAIATNLKRTEDKIKGRVKFIFQPAEETDMVPKRLQRQMY